MPYTTIRLTKSIDHVVPMTSPSLHLVYPVGIASMQASGHTSIERVLRSQHEPLSHTLTSRIVPRHHSQQPLWKWQTACSRTVSTLCLSYSDKKKRTSCLLILLSPGTTALNVFYCSAVLYDTQQSYLFLAVITNHPRSSARRLFLGGIADVLLRRRTRN